MITVCLTNEEHEEISLRAKLARTSASRYLVHRGLYNKLLKFRPALPPADANQRVPLERLLYELNRVFLGLSKLNHSLHLSFRTAADTLTNYVTKLHNWMTENIYINTKRK
ncbi:MAG: hypothetical protein HY231_22480 [Acidobacteria bacterium]|nr:hypothetical protein [Acidobacteriota bacterium]